MSGTPEHEQIEDAVRTKSKVLLGSQARVPVAAYVNVADGPYWARSMAHALEIAENKCSAELSRFADQGLLVAMDGAATWDRRRLFERAPGSETYWAMAMGLVRLAVGEVALVAGRDVDDLLDEYLRRIHRDDLAVLERIS